MAAGAAQVIQLHAQDGGLAFCWGIAQVKPELVTYMPETLKIESLQDLIHYVAKDHQESELESKVVGPAVKDAIISDAMKAIQFARVRMAWKSAHKVMEVADSQATGYTGKDDEVLPETIKQGLDQRWNAACPHFNMDPALTPPSSILHRLYREWVQGMTSQVQDLAKMRTARAERFQGDKVQISLGDATLTVSDHGTAGVRDHYRSVSHWHLLHRTLTNGGAYVGSH